MKQKILSVLLAAAMTSVWMLSATVSAVAEESSEEAETFMSGNYTYTLGEDDTATITAYGGHDTALEIPDALDGHTVTALGDDAFQSQTILESVTIPASVTAIGNSCFFGCEALASFSVESGSESFMAEDGVLLSADGRNLIAYPQAVEQTSYTIPDSVREIWPSAFAQTSLTEVVFPAELQYVDEWAFSYSAIETLELPDTVVEICDYAFAYCAGLTEIDFPASLHSIEAAAFAGCSNLEKVTFPEDLATVEMAAFAGTAMKEVTIPSSVGTIGFCAFGYEADMTTPVEDFVIYGTVGSEAQNYCTAEDSENDYANSFTFKTVLSDEDTAVATDNNKLQTTAEKQSVWQRVGKWVLLGIGVLILLAGGLILLFGGRGKKNGKTASKTAEKTKESAKSKENADTDTKEEQK